MQLVRQLSVSSAFFTGLPKRTKNWSWANGFKGAQSPAPCCFFFRLTNVTTNHPWNGNLMGDQPAKGMGWSSLVFSLITNNYVHHSDSWTFIYHGNQACSSANHYQHRSMKLGSPTHCWSAGTYLCLAIRMWYFNPYNVSPCFTFHGAKGAISTTTKTSLHRQLGTISHCRLGTSQRQHLKVDPSNQRKSIRRHPYMPMFAPVPWFSPMSTTQTTRYQCSASQWSLVIRYLWWLCVNESNQDDKKLQPVCSE